MLYSLNFIEKGHHERRLFYAEDETAAMRVLRDFAERTWPPKGEVWLETHPHGFIFQREKLGPHYWPPKKRKDEAR